MWQKSSFVGVVAVTVTAAVVAVSVSAAAVGVLLLLRGGVNGRRGITKKLHDRNDAIWFRAPVKRNLYPTYYAEIKKPMDLRTMEDKINNFE